MTLWRTKLECFITGKPFQLLIFFGNDKVLQYASGEPLKCSNKTLDWAKKAFLLTNTLAYSAALLMTVEKDLEH